MLLLLLLLLLLQELMQRVLLRYDLLQLLAQLLLSQMPLLQKLHETRGSVRGGAGSARASSAAAADVPVALVMWAAQALQRCHRSSAQVAAVSGARGEGIPLHPVAKGA